MQASWLGIAIRLGRRAGERLVRCLSLCLALLTAPSPALAAVGEAGFSEAPLVSSPQLGGATGLAWAPDGSNRLFVTRKDGVILVIKNGVLLPTPFATVTPIYDGSECGLLGIAFDPNFLVNRYLYVFVTVSASEQQIVRYTADGDTGTAKTTVVAGLPTVGANHDGGALGFGRDGRIYWGIGDLGNGTGVQGDLSSLASKIGRANLDGTPVSDNPHLDGVGPNADHIWARGFRNPFTLTFQPSTGLLWVQDVGASYEQFFIVRRGDHAGWNSYENNQPDGFILPVVKYRTNNVDRLTIAPAAKASPMAGAGPRGRHGDVHHHRTPPFPTGRKDRGRPGSASPASTATTSWPPSPPPPPSARRGPAPTRSAAAARRPPCRSAAA